MRRPAIAAVVLGALAYTTLVACSRLAWLADMAASFRPQAALGLVVAALVPLVLRARIAAAIVAACALWLAIPWLRVTLASKLDEGATGVPLSIAATNVFMHNRDSDAYRAWLERDAPDVLAVEEWPWHWRDPLDDLAGVYPHHVLFPERGDPERAKWFGIGLFTRLAVESSRVVRLDEYAMPLVEIVVLHGGERWTIRAIHPDAPQSSELWARRNRFLERIARELAWDDHTVLVGDFNTSSGSGAWTDLVEATGLHDSRAGFGWQPSWATDQKIRGIRTDLDHVLVGDAIRVLDRRLLDVRGSDHRGVLVRLATAR